MDKARLSLKTIEDMLSVILTYIPFSHTWKIKPRGMILFCDTITCIEYYGLYLLKCPCFIFKQKHKKNGKELSTEQVQLNRTLKRSSQFLIRH